MMYASIYGIIVYGIIIYGIIFMASLSIVTNNHLKLIGTVKLCTKATKTYFINKHKR